MNSAPENVNVNIINDTTNRVQNFNSNWSSNLQDASGAENATYDDSSGNRGQSLLTTTVWSTLLSQERQSAYKPGGEGWYRKILWSCFQFLQGKRFRLDFDGGVYGFNRVG